jgi:zinc D-Ala-D-Ala carboxypeptidase
VRHGNTDRARIHHRADIPSGAAHDRTDGQTLSPLNVSNPALAQLDPPLLNAVQDAARAATAQGVDLRITSGWRSQGFQQRLFDDAVRTHGSVDIARQFVASPDVSKHVVGQAVDVAPVDADEWLIRNGARFGLCQIYANELWHFELAVDQQGICPPCGPTPPADQPRTTFSIRSAASTRPGEACNRFDAASRRAAIC